MARDPHQHHPVCANATPTAGPSTSAGKHRIVKSTVDGSGIPSAYTSTGTTTYAYDVDTDDGRTGTANNVKLVDNDYSNPDDGVATFEAGEGEVRNTHPERVRRRRHPDHQQR